MAQQVEDNAALLLESCIEQSKNESQSYKSFLLTHLMRQMKLTSKVLGQTIRYRQIVEHNELLSVQHSAKHANMITVLKKVWLMRIFKDFVQDFQEEYLKQHKDLYALKPKVADRYLFQAFQMREFMKKGHERFEKKDTAQTIKLSSILMLSDEALYEAINKITKKFDQDQLDPDPALKAIENFTKYKYDLLTSFDAKCFKKEQYANRDYIYEDLRFLLGQAMKLNNDYISDMKLLCGPKINCNIKVKRHDNGSYNVVGVRRILAKWVQNLIESDKEMVQNRAFHNFIKNKTEAFDQFYINATEQIPPVQEKINEILLQLLINCVYEGQTKNKQFGFYIYDLLRSKMVVESIEDIQKVIDNLMKSEGTKQKVEVFRVKNRLPTHNRDVMVNFRYGNVIAAELQIGLGDNNVDEKLKEEKKRKYEYKHFMYELARSIFGPTMELIIIYEDDKRKNTIANMYSTGLMSIRTPAVQGLHFAEVKCAAGHKLLYVNREGIVKNDQEVCRFCFESLKGQAFLYCYQCSLTYCNMCYEDFRAKRACLVDDGKDPIQEITKPEEIIQKLHGQNLVMFHLSYSPASRLLISCLSYIGKQLKNNPIGLWKVDLAKRQSFRPYLTQLGIDRYPASVLFRDDKPEKMVVGASIFKLFDLVNLIRENKKKCPLNHELSTIVPRQYVKWQCNQCKKSRGVEKTPEKILYCKQCLYICCLKCGLEDQSQPIYSDPFGNSYLTTAWGLGSSQKCSKGHMMKEVRKIKSDNFMMKCYKCKQDFYFLRQFGFHQCEACKEKMCAMCASNGFSEIITVDEYANHDVQQYVLDLPLCFHCNHPYRTQKQRKMQWKCRGCQQLHQPNQEHIVCQLCLISICMKCADGLRKDEQSVKARVVQCACGSDYEIAKKIPLRLDPFTCNKCQKLFYYNTPHYICTNQFHLHQVCQQCASIKKVKLNLICLKQVDNQNSDVREFKLTVPGDMDFKSLEKLMIGWNIVPKFSHGTFRLRKQATATAIPSTDKVAAFSDREIFYFEYIDILSGVVGSIFGLEEALPKNLMEESVGVKFVKKTSIAMGENEWSLAKSPLRKSDPKTISMAAIEEEPKQQQIKLIKPATNQIHPQKRLPSLVPRSSHKIEPQDQETSHAHIGFSETVADPTPFSSARQDIVESQAPKRKSRRSESSKLRGPKECCSLI